MSLFDFIENKPDQQPETVTIPQGDQGITPAQGSKKTGRQKQASRSPKPKPEKLKFLNPCPVCQGTEFTHHSSNGGVFCNHCQPSIEGRPIIATGTRQQPETVEGLPCGGCGFTIYTKIENGYIFDDGTLADGWHCGGGNCHVKLLTGNKADQVTKDQAEIEQQPREPEPVIPTRAAPPLEHFRAAFPWIMKHLPELQAAGWTRPALFRRSRYRWPGGPWGAAWLSLWNKEEVQVTLTKRSGAINFTFTGTDGRTITQAAYPPPKGDKH